MIKIDTATAADAQALAQTMRAEDVAELRASSGLPPLEALSMGVKYGCLAANSPDGIVAMYGTVQTSDPLVGAVWMLGSTVLEKYPKSFVRIARDYFLEAHQTYPILTNFVDERNTLHVKWLKWMGVKFIARHPNYGAEGRPFLEFIHVLATNRNGGSDRCLGGSAILLPGATGSGPS